MKKEETKFQDKVMLRLNRLPKSWFFNVKLLSLCGIPDIIGVVKGRFVAIELKKSIDDAALGVNPLQDYILEKIALAGGFTSMTCPETWPYVYEEIEGLLDA